MKVPFVDLAAGVRAHRDEYLEAITGVLDSAYFAGGPEVAAFEEAFADFCGTEHAVAVSSGTDALIVALRALGIGPGDEVITAPNSFFATAEAIALVGATPVFADVRDDTLLLDSDRAAAAVTAKTRAIIPVHLFGQMAEMEAFEALCADRQLALLEDAAQAHGATRAGRRAGSIGAAGAFSFYPAKNLGAFGEGGAITTDSADVARIARELRDHGQVEKHEHRHVGYNARLPAMLCAALRVSLAYLSEANDSRRRAASRYRERLAGVEGVRPIEVDAAGEPVHHLFVVRVRDRAAVGEALGAAGVATAVHYPVPIHLQPAFAELGHSRGAFPVAEAACDEILSLPMFPTLDDAQIDYVASCLRDAVQTGAP